MVIMGLANLSHEEQLRESGMISTEKRTPKVGKEHQNYFQEFE